MSIEFYPFELHTHSLHSDGSFTPEELARNALEEGLAGFALTDHNTFAGTSYARQAAEKLGLVFLPGIEWTTFYGHITVLGGDFGVDWREVNPETVCTNAANIKEKGGCAGIAHPFRIGYPICTGGSDGWGIDNYKDFTHYEVWSYRDPSEEHTNRLAEERYRFLAANGNRLACVYGRDWHAKEDGLFAATYLGIDGALITENALEAIRKGRSYVSTGVRLEANLTDDKGNRFFIGDQLPVGEYTLDTKLTAPHGGFSNGNTFSIKTISLVGADGKAEKHETVDGKFTCRLKLKRGFLQLTAEGDVNGNERKLLIATPFFIK